jgi:hypothetical protein
MLCTLGWELGGTALDRHRVVAVAASALLLVFIAGCGGSSASPSSAPTAAPTEAPVPSADTSEAPSSAAVGSPSVAPHTTATALCAGVAIRKSAKTDGDVIVRVKAGAKVRVVQVVIGDAYTAGSCGVSGDSWLKVDRIGAKSIKAQYGVPFGYVAAGFFQ